MADTEPKGALKEVGEGFKAILERVADFFDIFDLSFIVSGATSAGAIVFWGWRAHVELPPIPNNWISGAVLVIASYVLGLVCFALGRWVRMGWRKRRADQSFYRKFVQVLTGHGLSGTAPFAGYLERREELGHWRLYVRLWAEIRDSPKLKSSFSHLRHYWVLAATYDGVATALIFWALTFVACIFGIGGAKAINPRIGIPVAGAFLLAAVACSQEAGRYVDYQVEELVASVAAVRTDHGS